MEPNNSQSPQSAQPVQTQTGKKKQKSNIDYGHLAKLLWKNKKAYYKIMAIAFVVGCIIAFSIPKTYTCQVMLAPELTTARSSGSLSALAASFGMKLGSGALGNEALFPTLYPDLMNSVDFKTSLFPIMVHKEDSTRMMSYYDYLMNEQKRPWWTAAISNTLGALINLIATKDTVETKDTVDPFRLTKRQTKIAKMISKNIICDVDQKTMVITIQVRDQDPWIAATMADSVKARLQDFITNYRTNKARIDLEQIRLQYQQAKHDYDRARQMYAEFADANQDIILQTVRMRQTELENEMQLKFNAYSTLTLQLQGAEAKVLEDTPAFTTLQSATVPVQKSGPGRKKILIVLLFLAFLYKSARILDKEGELKPLLGLSK